METIIGIDFGTTNSVVGYYDRGTPRILEGDDGESLMPSAVYIDEDKKVHVGYAARNVALLYPERTVTSVKRLVGRDSLVTLADRAYPPEQIASHLFAALRERSEKALECRVDKAVVSVPAYYDERRRRAIESAASLAGLHVVRLLNEPTAAALAHNVHGAGTILVYDLGGGTFDVSVLEAGEGIYRVLASRGHAQLGGDDFDRAIVDFLLDDFREETGLDLADDRLAQHKLRIAAERAKIELSSREEAHVEIPFIGTNVLGACHLDSVVTRHDLERLLAGFIAQTIRLTKGALNDAGVRPDEIDHLLLVGGSTKIPIVREAVERLIDRAAEPDVNPDLAVARGAAHEAGIISGAAAETLLVDVTPLGLGVETAHEGFATLLPRNTVLPAQASAVFTTVADNQRRARVTVRQGEHSKAGENTVLGSFDLDGIERAQSGEPDIEVKFDIDINGILHVQAKDLATRSEHQVTLQTPIDLDNEAVNEEVELAREAELERAMSGYSGVER